MESWDASVTVADSTTFTAGAAESADISELTDPTVLVELENLEGNASDDVTVRVVGDVGTYTIDTRTLNALGGYFVDVPQANTVEVESANGATYSAEVRASI